MVLGREKICEPVHRPVALGACMVASTKWPVSAAERAVAAVSWSRSSPITITSGSSRSAALTPSAKEGVSDPTSRWFHYAFPVFVEEFHRVLKGDYVVGVSAAYLRHYGREG